MRNVTVARRTTPPNDRRRLLGAAVLAQPVLIGVNGTFHPEVDLEAASMLAGAADSPTSWYAVHLVAALGALLGAPAAFGLRRLLHDHSRLGDIALVTAVVAATVLGLSFMAEASVLRLAVTADMGEAARLALADEYLRTPEFYAVGIGVVATSAAAILFSAGLLLERRVAAWMPTTTIVGAVVALGAQPGTALAPAAFGLVAIAAFGLARHVVRSPSSSSALPCPRVAGAAVHAINP